MFFCIFCVTQIKQQYFQQNNDQNFAVKNMQTSNRRMVGIHFLNRAIWVLFKSWIIKSLEQRDFDYF